MRSAQVEETVKTLDANAVQDALESVAPQAATATYPITISLFENFGRAFINWQLDPNYGIGNKDVVQLREGSVLWANSPLIQTTSGQWDTGHDWGTGLNASYWTWNYGSAAGYRQLAVTPNT